MILSEVNDAVIAVAKHKFGSELLAVYLIGSQSYGDGTGRDYDYVFIFSDQSYQTKHKIVGGIWITATGGELEEVRKEVNRKLGKAVKIDIVTLSETSFRENEPAAQAAVLGSGLVGKPFNCETARKLADQFGFHAAVAHHGIRIYPEMK
ncbi:hypothetical protein [Franconibacter daqui]|uniref:hypothetical protein n=1 Tax=Franconibacter daqui TaxID=2047724 RepID=UPI002DB983B4|nr:hypothetical protein [Franconibacter daqui]MEB5924605.1 hypothetical protein [Franconibacter daqui]